MKKLVLETTSPFQGLPELVAYNEGLFEKEGIKVEWADRDEAGVKKADGLAESPKGIDPFGSHGTLFEQGKADMYNACEWGNYCRVGATGVGSRQVGRRAIVAYAAILVRPDSPVYTPQQLANRTVGVPFYAGTHYLALHLLEGFLPRDQIKVVPRAERLAQPLQHDDEGRNRGDDADGALHHARREERLPRRSARPSSRHRGRVRQGRRRTYAAFNRAVREAVRRINADKTNISITSSTITRRRTRRSARSRSPTCAPGRSWSRSCADPGGRAGAHLRVGEELGHAGGDGLAARARQHGCAGTRPRRRLSRIAPNPASKSVRSLFL